MNRVRKAVIPAAGYGTGFLPATKAQPKELLPIVDKPIIQFIIEEAVASGIEEILIITGKHKRAIEDHFDSNIELEDNLEKKGKHELLELVKSTTQTNLFFVRQSYPKGLGDAIYHAKAFVNNEPFVVMLGDNIMMGDTPATKELVDLFEATQTPNVAVLQTDKDIIDQYGVIEVNNQSIDQDKVYEVTQFIEKPDKASAPSNLAIAGRYVLTPDIFDILEKQAPDAQGQIQLTDAIHTLNKQRQVLAKELSSQRYDVGNKQGYLKMSIDYGLHHKETDEGLKAYIQKLAPTLD